LFSWDLEKVEKIKMPRLTLKDLEKLQAQHPDYRMELVEGEIIIMSPFGLESEEVAVEISRQLANWVRPRRLGRVVGSSAGFKLPNPNEDVRAPDVSFSEPPTLYGLASSGASNFIGDCLKMVLRPLLGLTSPPLAVELVPNSNIRKASFLILIAALISRSK
jgi:Putative restriction endonuclease